MFSNSIVPSCMPAVLRCLSSWLKNRRSNAHVERDLQEVKDMLSYIPGPNHEIMLFSTGVPDINTPLSLLPP
jgi:hypothetical protein